MRKSLLLSIVLFFLLANSYGQPGTSWIDLNGKVINKTLETPLEATITLESLPFGADNRVFKSENSTGEFSFKVPEAKEYKVRVTAKGYVPISEEIVTRSDLGRILFEMVPNGAGTLLDLNINFNQGRAQIREDSYEELNKLLQMLQEYPSMVIQLEGHTDFRGSASANLRLSEKRVESVKEYLTSKNVYKDRIKTKAFGGTNPVSRESTAEAKLLNRRVQARILKSE